MNSLLTTLKLVTSELKQIHSHYYRNCGGGCPTDTYLKQTELVIKGYESTTLFPLKEKGTQK